METVTESIYDFPRYYDLIFGTDCAAEIKFVCDINENYLDGKAKRLFEPACGTGRLLFGLARKGFDVEGIDLNEKAVEFSNQRFQRHGLMPAAWVADMSDFRAKRKWDLAFNTINSFRHLTTAQAAASHLKCMAEQTKKGGLYLIGLHLTPTTEVPLEGESWSARRGRLSVQTHMWTVDRNPAKRMERFGMRFDVYTPKKLFRINDVLNMRSYTPKQFESMLAQSGGWEIAGTYDFAHDIKQPIQVDSSTEDVVYVLRKTN